MQISILSSAIILGVWQSTTASPVGAYVSIGTFSGAISWSETDNTTQNDLLLARRGELVHSDDLAAASLFVVGGFAAESTGDTSAAKETSSASRDASKNPGDNTSPSPNEQCTASVALAGVYTSSASAKYAYERPDCPSGNETPSCSDPNCIPDENNKCTKEHPGCDCIPKEECPHLKGLGYMPLCRQCGGSTGDKKCKGDPADGFRWKDCPCIEDFNDPVGCEFTGLIHPEDPDEVENTLKKFVSIRKWTDASFSKDPNDEPPAGGEC